MHLSVKAAIACAIFAAIAMAICGLLPFVADLPLATDLQLGAYAFGAGVLLWSSIELLKHQWHQPMWKEH